MSSAHSRAASFLGLMLILAVCGAMPGPAGAADRPNVVFLLADDLGWGDLSCHGNSYIRTPNLDRLAREGTDFHQFNTASPVCSPSRIGFMTGQFPARFGVRSAIGGIRKNRDIPQADWLDPKAAMLPRILQGAGYVTGHIGKWHLQSGQADDAPAPGVYGIDEPAMFPGTSHPTVAKTVVYDQIWDEALSFLRKHRSERFYLNVWMHETHLAHLPSKQSLESNAHLDERRRIYAAVATDADRGVGRILDALKELDLEKNTIVVFSSDNGPENTHATKKTMGDGHGGYYSIGETGGLKGRKRSLHEGGVCTAFLVRWPGRVPAGRVDKVTSLSATDLLPTVCAAAGVDLPAGFTGDGENMLAAWEGREQRRTKPIFWDWCGTDRPPTNWCRWAVRDGDWKLITDDGRRKELYRVSDDRAEARNLAGEHPDVVARLSAQLEAWKASLPKEPPKEFLSKRGGAKEAPRSGTQPDCP